MIAAVSWASDTSEDSDPVERRMREVLTRRDHVAFGPAHEIALAKSKRR